ncbi:MAG: ATP-binding protein [Lachnospiraceae bacterium]|nr:ATP-binding protein [Lachnospiraceae bacterium]
MNNPYTLVFGKEPAEHISRMAQEATVIQAFSAEIPAHQVYMISGVRGSGKTVFMTEIQKRFQADDGWITVEINPEKDMLLSLAAKLSSENKLAKIFQNAKINLSFWGIGLEVGGEVPITDIETAVSKMLESLKKHNKRVLITVDEVTGNDHVKEFVAAFQIMLRQDLPVYLLMTGLYENIYNLQNQKSLTFLYRAPKVELQPLSMTSIAQNYGKNLPIAKEEAQQMAKLTRGYSFAFQVLGYFTWEAKGNFESVMTDYREYLDQFVYDKIWSELSKKDKEILYAIMQTPSGRIEEIRELLKISTNEFNPYRQRLINKGIISGKVRGIVRFELPMFEEYIAEHMFG